MLKYILLCVLFIADFSEAVLRTPKFVEVNDYPLVAPHLIEAARKLRTITSKRNPETCMVCEQVLDGIISLRRSNATREVMMDYLNQLCNLYTDWGKEACQGEVDIQADTLLYIIDNKKELRPAAYCSVTYQAQGCEDPNADSWSIPLPPRPSKVKNSLSDHENGANALHILQITDVHIDPLYIAGSNARCSEPLCCENGIPAKAEDAAGYWGDYNVCDMPVRTIEDMMDDINDKHKQLDWIYFTGDIVSHRSWASSKQTNIETIKVLYALLDAKFPNKTVYPILGNHEPHPGDFYSPEGIDKNLNVSTQWLLDLVAEEWSRWLPNDTQSTIKKGGFYTLLVKPGFRIIALNNNVCFRSNLWLVYENKDTFGQLQWFVDVLTEAEKNGEKVHVLSHIPSSDDYSSCVKIWSREFTKIVLRFSDTIAAQFNGHTHLDEFKLYFANSTNKQRVKSVAYNGASFTTFVGSNPNYKLYQVDNNNLTVTDYDLYSFNLTQANSNANSTPAWSKLYSFKEAYGLPDLTMESLGNLYQRMASNDSDNQLIDQYFKYLYSDSDIYNKKGCDKSCKKYWFCQIGTAETSESIYC